MAEARLRDELNVPGRPAFRSDATDGLAETPVLAACPPEAGPPFQTPALSRCQPATASPRSSSRLRVSSPSSSSLSSPPSPRASIDESSRTRASSSACWPRICWPSWPARISSDCFAWMSDSSWEGAVDRSGSEQGLGGVGGLIRRTWSRMAAAPPGLTSFRPRSPPASSLPEPAPFVIRPSPVPSHLPLLARLQSDGAADIEPEASSCPWGLPKSAGGGSGGRERDDERDDGREVVSRGGGAAKGSSSGEGP